jgi:hypothetical protein
MTTFNELHPTPWSKYAVNFLRRRLPILLSQRSYKESLVRQLEFTSPIPQQLQNFLRLQVDLPLLFIIKRRAHGSEAE